MEAYLVLAVIVGVSLGEIAASLTPGVKGVGPLVGAVAMIALFVVLDVVYVKIKGKKK